MKNFWKPKRRIYSSETVKSFSIIKKLKKEKKINEAFLTTLSNLSLEEIIALKLEKTTEIINHRLYNLSIYKGLANVCRKAAIMWALAAARTHVEAALILGISRRNLYYLSKKYGIRKYFKDKTNLSMEDSYQKFEDSSF